MSTSAEQITNLIAGYTDIKAYFEAQRNDWESRVAAAETDMDAFIAGHYEQGNWTPEIYFGGAQDGIAYQSRDGKYFKTGQIVHITARIYLSSKGTSTGAMTIGGLPLATGLYSGYLNRPVLISGSTRYDRPLLGQKTDNNTYLDIYTIATGARVAAIEDELSDSSYLSFQMSYDTSA